MIRMPVPLQLTNHEQILDFPREKEILNLLISYQAICNEQHMIQRIFFQNITCLQWWTTDNCFADCSYVHSK